MLSVITNLGAGLSDTPPSHKEVQEAADKLAPKFIPLLSRLSEELSREK